MAFLLTYQKAESAFTALRWLMFAVGSILLYAGRMLYEDEERKLQSKVERWWLLLAYKQPAVLGVHIRLFRGAAQWVSYVFDRLLGKRLISLSAVSVSACLSMATAAWAMAEPVSRMGKTVLEGLPETLHVLSIILLAAGLLPIITTGARIAKVLTVSFTAFFLSLAVWISSQHGEGYEVLRIFLLFVPVAILSDFFAIVGARFLLKIVSRLEHLRVVVGVILAQALIGLLIVVVPIALGFQIVAMMNIFTATVFLFTAVVTATLALHRLVWAAVLRPLYAVQRNLVGHDGLLTATGCALIFVSLFSPEANDLLRSLLKRLLGGD